MLAAKLAADRALRSSELKAAKAEAAAEAATAAAEAAEAASAFRKQHDVETKLKALTDEFNQQALLVEAAEKAEDEKTVALANEVSSLNALTNEHEVSEHTIVLSLVACICLHPVALGIVMFHCFHLDFGSLP